MFNLKSITNACTEKARNILDAADKAADNGWKIDVKKSLIETTSTIKEGIKNIETAAAREKAKELAQNAKAVLSKVEDGSKKAVHGTGKGIGKFAGMFKTVTKEFGAGLAEGWNA